MKNMRKIASVLLALVMVFALAAPVFATEIEAETYSITINNTATGHTYEAYQIFKGDLNGETLSNVEWGASVTSHEGDATAIVEKLDKAYAGEDKLSVEGLLAMITLGEEVAATSTQTNGQYVISGLAAGYYLVKDAYGSLNGTNDAYTQYIVKVVKDTEASPKGNVPQVEKKVKDINDSKDADFSAWQDSADHDIGDAVPFQLTATLANNVSAYSTYKIIFHDTLSAGLTYNGDAKVYLVTGENRKDVTSYFTPNYNAETGKLTISCNNVKAEGFEAGNGAVIVVEYTAELNENAVHGSTGNPNVVYLEYSNNPNWDADGDGKPDEPGTPGTPGGEEPTGKTPEDKVIVFTFKVVVNKVDENKNPLVGAGFTLFKLDKESGEYEQVGDEVTGTQMTKFVWKGLDDGDYKLVESTTPAGYNTIDDIYFTITAEHEVLADNPTLTKLEGGDMFTGSVSTGELTGNVINHSGVVLPETDRTSVV